MAEPTMRPSAGRVASFLRLGHMYHITTGYVGFHIRQWPFHFTCVGPTNQHGGGKGHSAPSSSQYNYSSQKHMPKPPRVPK